jgi:succinate-acetate transporter protein
MDDNESPSKKTANPAVLGLLAFGLTTTLLSLHNLGLYPMDSMVLAMGLLYGGAAQIVAGLLEYKAGNTLGATAFTSYGFFWIIFVMINTGLALGAAPDSVSLGSFFGIWGLMTLFLFIATVKAPLALRIVFLTLAVLFFVIAISKITEITDIMYLAGALGVFGGGTAFYVAVGEVLNEQYGRTVLPLG